MIVIVKVEADQRVVGANVRLDIEVTSPLEESMHELNLFLMSHAFSDSRLKLSFGWQSDDSSDGTIDDTDFGLRTSVHRLCI